METHISEPIVYSKHPLRRSRTEEVLNTECDDGTPKRKSNFSKRRQVLERQLSDGKDNLEDNSSSIFAFHGEITNVNKCNIGISPPLMGIDEYGSGMYDGVSPTLPIERSLEEYRHLAHSQFRRIYYDLSRGIGIPNDGVGYLFKYAINDISTSTYGMYGEIRISCLKRICKEMERFGLDDRSVVLDLGSGRGVPSIMFAHQKRVFASLGIELCPVSYELSVNNLLHYLKLDVVKCVLENTDFGKASKSGAQVKQPAYDFKGEYEEPTCTPRNSRLNKDASSGCNIATISKSDLLGSVDTHYDDGSTEVGEMDVTPIREIGDDGAYYRALDSFKRVAPSLGLAFCNEDISAFDHYNGATHIYSFDIAMEKALVNNIVRQFINTKTAWLFASFNSDLLERFALPDCFLAAKIPCQMYKSGENRCCYIYVKNGWEKIKKHYDCIIAGLMVDIKPGNAVTVNTDSFNTQLDAMSNLQHNENNENDQTTFKWSNELPSYPMISDDLSPETHDEKMSGRPFDVMLSRFNEPVQVIELMKLAKMSLGAQMGWYMKKMNRTGAVMTRSKRLNGISVLKARLCQYRSKLMEFIATSADEETTEKYVEMLRNHINNMYMAVHSLPNPPTWL
ncbi:hypothetical protein BgAZ_103000 [Babesia gibsoni]|uniref:DOT1 domain-containing protein n=1 Tax=Babesia gibsoni TaxID=33632 RepID=A0AAD8PFM5_BABGI|nr:hypothetical protein BgAZ_103000 [Babesia gibsoni]